MASVIGRNAKFIVALLFAAVLALQSALTDDKVTTMEWWGILVAVLTAAGVWVVPNAPVSTKNHLE